MGTDWAGGLTTALGHIWPTGHSLLTPALEPQLPFLRCKCWGLDPSRPSTCIGRHNCPSLFQQRLNSRKQATPDWKDHSLTSLSKMEHLPITLYSQILWYYLFLLARSPSKCGEENSCQRNYKNKHLTIVLKITALSLSSSAILLSRWVSNTMLAYMKGRLKPSQMLGFSQ